MGKFDRFKSDMLDMAGEALDDVRHTFERVMYGQELTGNTEVNSEFTPSNTPAPSVDVEDTTFEKEFRDVWGEDAPALEEMDDTGTYYMNGEDIDDDFTIYETEQAKQLEYEQEGMDI